MCNCFFNSTRRKTSFQVLWVVLVVVANLTLPMQCAAAADVNKNSAPQRWRLIWKDDPGTTATLSWDTQQKGTTHQAHYRLADQRETSPAQQVCQHNGLYGATNPERKAAAEKAGNTWFHHARLTGLKPDSVYEVRMDSDGHLSPWFHFRTAPVGDRDFTLLAGGDSRSDAEKRREVNHLMRNLLDASTTKSDSASEVLALLHGGDYIENGDNLDQWNQWGADHEGTTTAAGRLLPIIPTRGNHDGGPLFAQRFDFPVDDGNYYATNFGPRLGIVTLNTEYSIAGSQKEWLQGSLAALRPKHRWLLAQYHRAAYPAVKWPSGALLHWVPLFDQYLVDLVVESDGHAMKRTVPIRNGKRTEDGTVYVGEGGLGVPTRPAKSNRWYLRSPGFAGEGHHVIRIRFHGDRMKVDFVSLEGKVMDEYVR